MATSTLRPLSVGEILDAAVSVVTRHWKPLLGSLLLISTPLWVLFVLLLASIDPTFFQVTAEPSTTEDPSGNAIAGLLVLVVALMLVFLISFVAVFKGVCDAWVGRKPTLGRSLGFGARRAGWVFLLSLLWIPSISVFSLFCGIPAFWLGTVWCLSIPAMLFERVGPFKALGRSFSLIGGRFWESLIVVIVVFVVYQVLAQIVSVPIILVASLVGDDNGVTNAIAYGVAGLLSSVIGVPYMVALLTILYFDQRVRKEGFDIQLLASDAALDDDPNAPLPAPLVAPQGYVVPPPPGPPQGWQQPGGWQPGGDQPLRWGPAAEPPPAQGGWTPPGAAPAGDAPSPWMTPGADAPPTGAAPPEDAPSPWMNPGADAPPAEDAPPPTAGDASPPPAPDWSPQPAAPVDAPSAEDAPPPVAGEASPPPAPDWSPPPAAPAEDASPPTAPTERLAPPPAAPAEDASPPTAPTERLAPPPPSPGDSSPPPAAPADAPPAEDDAPPPPAGPSPWMSPPEDRPGWKPTPWQPTEWKPRKDEDER